MIQIDIQKRLKMAEGADKLSVKLNIEMGEFVVIFGKSGAGKTSLLRMLSGLLTPDVGKISNNGESWFDDQQRLNVPPQKRNIGFVFQGLALFPNMTVKENLLYAAGKNKDENYLNHLLKITELQDMQNRYPQTLSGGQNQRVAIIRALARKPKLLLLDEPFSSLDMDTRKQLKRELKSIHQEFKLTTLLVSHDALDIEGAADRYVKLQDGKNLEVTPSENSVKILKGKVLNLHAFKEGAVLEILINETVFKLPVLQNNILGFKIGDVINIEMKENAIRILK